ncbi:MULTISPECIES: FAD/NAD(P)-binding protein [unclassified Rhizobium]|uniref:FAD/NAD(P)-binding protein n=1 Tax=unclassified Rhizobium TaxID=2613769 RepID=UPI000AFF61EE|nr:MULTISPECIES: FAD/NAD(P)-binding protein [unclassified Rhizobium]RKD35564.1 FAD-NAD(P)-binding protein [Rhizobium sp. WW_1]
MTEAIRKMFVNASGRWKLPSNDKMVPERIAIVGTGPRGISVIERIASKLTERQTLRPLVIYAIDSVEVGCGRIWRTDQPDWLIMNTRCKNATMFPNAPDEGAWRPGYGPTFMEWWRQVDTNYPGPSGYAPRGLYGKYLKFVLDAVELNLPDNMSLERVQDRVVNITEHTDQYELTFESGRSALHVDRLIVCSGYPHREKSKHAENMAGSSVRHLTSFDILETFQSGLSLPLDLSGQVIGIRGLGLSFYDVLSELTIGRGGRYVVEQGTLQYVPSGNEPKLIVAGSRGGLPLPVRGKDDRPANLVYVPQFFTASRVASIRANGPACFRSSYLPWITAEVNLVYVEKVLGSDQYGQFRKTLDARELTSDTVMDAMSELARPYGIDKLLDLEALAAPFQGLSFDNQDEFRRAIVSVVGEDVARADRGEFNDPIKAALDVLRHIRPTIRKAVDLGGLTRSSHHDFITKVARTIAFLSSGPSRTRAKQLLALIQYGKLELLGPSATFRKTEEAAVVASSDKVKDYSIEIDVLIDAYVAAPNVDLDENPVIRSLADAGILRNFMGVGGAEVTSKPFHPITVNGEVKDRIHVLGIPTESARWFLHVGLVEPGAWDEFIDDADAIANTSIQNLVFGAPEAGSFENDLPTNGNLDPDKYLN